jgi:hypothetical protein
VHLVDFIIRKCVTMHGHVNVKFRELSVTGFGMSYISSA